MAKRISVVDGSSETMRTGVRRLRSRAFGVVRGGGRIELVTDELGIAHDPRVVSRLDRVRVTGADVGLGAVVVRDVHLARDHHTEVAGLAAVGPDDRLDALRPAPPRL